jgi:hypothetical protein
LTYSFGSNLTGAADELWGLSTIDQETQLPPEPVVQSLVNSKATTSSSSALHTITNIKQQVFFKSIATLYPVLDEHKFRTQLQQFYTERKRGDPLWGFLLNMVLCTAYAGQQDTDYNLNNTDTWHQSCLAQVLSSTILVLSRMSEMSAQIFFLTVRIS